MSKAYLTICAAIAAIAAAPAAAAPAKPAQSAQAPTRAALTKGIDASFKGADTNGDGVLDVKEVAAAEAKGLKQRVGVARQRMEAEFTKLDTNKDGNLSKAEFMAAAPQAPSTSPNGADILAKLDKNKDGKVNADEYRTPMLAQFDRIDSNKDGRLSDTEIKAAARK